MVGEVILGSSRREARINICHVAAGRVRKIFHVVWSPALGLPTHHRSMTLTLQALQLLLSSSTTVDPSHCMIPAVRGLIRPPLLLRNYSTMGMPSRLRDYAVAGNANPGPGDPRAPKGGELTKKAWHVFSGNTWTPVLPSYSTSSESPALSSPVRLTTWNVDGWAPSANARLDAILLRILALKPDLILLQELSSENTEHLLAHPTVRGEWYCTESEKQGPGVPIIQATLARRERFDSSHLGEVHRMSLPSRYERFALVADVLVGSGSSSKVVRTVNVHLDSLAHDPSYRPAQVRLTAQSIASAGGHGLIAGDWNSVLPIDDSLCAENGMIDAWEANRPGEDGFTWNWDGRSKEPFPPNRLDKLALAGLRCALIEVLEPGTLQVRGGVDWSDHCGLSAEVAVEGAKSRL